MKRLIQRRAFGVALIVNIVALGLFAIVLARKPIRLAVVRFETGPVKTVDDIDSIVWDLRKAGEDFGILSEKLIVRTGPIEAP